VDLHQYQHAVAIAALLAAVAIPAVSQAASCEDVLDSSQDTQVFASVVKQAGLEHLNGSGTVTIFAPTNEAMRSDTALMQMLAKRGAPSPADTAGLRRFAQAHIVSGVHGAADMQAGTKLTTMAGISVTPQPAAPSDMTLLRSSGSGGAGLAGMQAGAEARMTGGSRPCDGGVVIPIDHPLVTVKSRQAGPFQPEAGGAAATGSAELSQPGAGPRVTTHPAGPFQPEAGSR